MDLDIFERKVTMKGYCFPKLDNYKVLYKYIIIGNHEYCIESSDISKKVIYINIIRFISNDNKWKEEPVVTIECKSHQDVIEVVNKLSELENGNIVELFSLILTGSNMKFIKKKTWIKK